MIRDALVVGINTYQDDNLRNLNAAAIDGEAIANILEQYGKFNVRRLPEAIDSDTKKPYIAKINKLSLLELQEAIENLFDPPGKRVPDTALLYFSGHGVRQNKTVQEGYLCASNVYPQIGFNGLSLQWLRRLLQKSPIKQQIVWLDCCHSGELLNFDEAYPGTEGLARDRFFIASSRAFEPSLVDLETSYSVLTKYLLSGLDPNRCPKKWITSDNLTVFINENLQNENQRPVIFNFGESIELTCTWEVTSFLSKGEENEDICPYKGLAYFDCNNVDPQYFYGREKLTDELLNRVRKNNFLAILGASGSGKSSVLRAGLLHQLQLARKLPVSKNWKIKIMLPGEHPLQNLALSWLEPDLSDAKRAIELDRIKSLLKKGSEGLVTLVQASTANRVILVIDQFEEIFTLCQDVTEREAFFQCLLEALAKTNNKLCLILAMRIDFFGKCFEREYSDLGNKIQNKDNFIAILPMKRKELKQAIIKPAEKVKLTLELGLADEILRDIKSSPGSLPLLQDTLTELWNRRVNNQLKFTAYSQLGRIGGTLNQRATEVYNSLSKQEQDAAQHIFLSLTTLGEGTEDTRRRVLKRDLITAKHDEKLVNNVVQKLADERLIITRERIDLSSTIGKEPEIDVAHEALIRNWSLLRQWLEDNREQLRQKRKIEDAAQEWKASGEKTEYLLSKKRLNLAKDFQKEKQEKYPLSKLEAIFIDRSSKYQRYEQLKFLGLISIILIFGTSIGYPLVREIQLYFDHKSAKDCNNQNSCSEIVDVLERLVKARKSLRLYNLRETNLESNTNLSGADLSGADLSRANLKIVNFSGADLSRANFSGADLSGAILKNANLERTNLSGVNLESTDLSGTNLSRATLKSTDLNNAILKSTNLSGADLSGAKLFRANLIGANLESTDLSSAILASTYLISANLIGANLESTDLESTNLSSANLIGANLSGANLKSSYLIGADLYRANLKIVNFSGAILSRANLASTDLSGAILIGTNLSGADLFSADLFGADLFGANLKSVSLMHVNNLTLSQIKLACNWESAFYKGYFDPKKEQWIVDKSANQQYIEQLKQDKASNPQKEVDCSRWGNS